MPELMLSQELEEWTSALFISQNFQGGEAYCSDSHNLPGLDWNVWIGI